MNNDFTKTMNYPLYLEDIAKFCACFGITSEELADYLFD